MLIKYKFEINSEVVSPIWGDDFVKNIEKQTDSEFFIESLSGKFTLVGVDFDYINSQAFDTEFLLMVSYWNGTSFDEYANAKFYKTDCKFNDNDKVATVKLSSQSEYDSLLENQNHEYDLIKLTPEKRTLEYDKRPLLQIYIPGATTIGCFLAGNSWEQEVISSISDENALIKDYYFSLSNEFDFYDLTTYAGDATAYEGLYQKDTDYTWLLSSRTLIFENNKSAVLTLQFGTNDKTTSDIGSLWKDSNGNLWQLASIAPFEVVAFLHDNLLPSAVDVLTHEARATNTSDINYTTKQDEHLYLFKLKNDLNEVLFVSSVSYNLLSSFPNEIPLSPVPNTVASGSLYAKNIKTNVYSRYILDKDNLAGVPTEYIPIGDIVENNRNYSRVIGVVLNSVTAGITTTPTPTEYGLAPNNEYYTPPDFPGPKMYPISRNSWNELSFWFFFIETLESIEEDGRVTISTNDASPISSVISVLLSEIAPGITHEATIDYSQFLYGVNPISGRTSTLLITQKTNVLNGSYDKPAQKAPIKFSELMAMLRDVYRCYYFIADGKLRIEHIDYFRNGGSYSGTPLLNADLTILKDRNKYPWATSTSEYEFDKENLPSRYEFKWMDEVTDGFEGSPIVVKSNYVDKSKLEEVNISSFNSDIDYMLLNPSEINNDGFALFDAVEDEGVLKLTYARNSVGNADYLMQNGYLSFTSLLDIFYIYDLPASDVYINGVQSNIGGLKKSKKQTVKYPSINDPDPQKLVRTSLGDGQIEKISVNLASRMNTITLMYEPE